MAPSVDARMPSKRAMAQRQAGGQRKLREIVELKEEDLNENDVEQVQDKAQAVAAAAAAPPKDDGRRLNFGHRLVVSDKPTRDRALKQLTRFLGAKNYLSEHELLRLWKGLYYNMWMADKVPVQMELADRLASLIHVVKPELALPFQRAFWQTMLREWHTIDHHRLDKFYALLRRYVREGLVFLARQKWDAEIVTAWTSMLTELPLQPGHAVVPNGIRFHVCQVFIEELPVAAPEPLSSETLLALLAPFFHIVSRTTDVLLYDHVVSTIFHVIARINDAPADYMEDDETVGDSGVRKFAWFDVSHLEAIATRLFDVAADPETLQKHRRNLYDLSRHFREESARADVHEVYAVPEAPPADDADGTANAKRKRRRRRRGKQSSPGEEEEESSSSSTSSSSSSSSMTFESTATMTASFGDDDDDHHEASADDHQEEQQATPSKRPRPHATMAMAAAAASPSGPRTPTASPARPAAATSSSSSRTPTDSPAEFHTPRDDTPQLPSSAFSTPVGDAPSTPVNASAVAAARTPKSILRKTRTPMTERKRIQFAKTPQIQEFCHRRAPAEIWEPPLPSPEQSKRRRSRLSM